MYETSISVCMIRRMLSQAPFSEAYCQMVSLYIIGSHKLSLSIITLQNCCLHSSRGYRQVDGIDGKTATAAMYQWWSRNRHSHELALASHWCWLYGNADGAAMLAIQQCWRYCYADCTTLLTVLQCWLLSNAGGAVLVAVLQCWLYSHVGGTAMLVEQRCWLHSSASCTSMMVTPKYCLGNHVRLVLQDTPQRGLEPLGCFVLQSGKYSHIHAGFDVPASALDNAEDDVITAGTRLLKIYRILVF